MSGQSQQADMGSSRMPGEQKAQSRKRKIQLGGPEPLKRTIRKPKAVRDTSHSSQNRVCPSIYCLACFSLHVGWESIFGHCLTCPLIRFHGWQLFFHSFCHGLDIREDTVLLPYFRGLCLDSFLNYSYWQTHYARDEEPWR